MGLPMWRAPSPSEVKKATKVDLTAATRSPIRRRSPAPRRTSRRRLDALHPVPPGRPPRPAETGSLRYRPDRPYGHRVVADRDADARNPSSFDSSATIPLPPAPESRHFTRDSLFAQLAAIGRRENSSGHTYDHASDPGLTPNFAPAHFSAAVPRDLHIDPSGTYGFLVVDDRYEEDEDGLSDSGDSYGDPPSRPLRRSPPISSYFTFGAEVDGLGDRSRSPESDVDDQWDTLLSTVTPDPHLPSASSSFTSASAAASASFSSTGSSQSGANSRASSRTSLTASTPQPCEDGAPSPSDSGLIPDQDVSPDTSAAAAVSDRSGPRLSRNPPPPSASSSLRRTATNAARYIRNYQDNLSRQQQQQQPPQSRRESPTAPRSALAPPRSRSETRSPHPLAASHTPSSSSEDEHEGSVERRRDGAERTARRHIDAEDVTDSSKEDSEDSMDEDSLDDDDLSSSSSSSSPDHAHPHNDPHTPLLLPPMHPADDYILSFGVDYLTAAQRQLQHQLDLHQQRFASASASAPSLAAAREAAAALDTASADLDALRRLHRQRARVRRQQRRRVLRRRERDGEREGEREGGARGEV